MIVNNDKLTDERIDELDVFKTKMMRVQNIQEMTELLRGIQHDHQFKYDLFKPINHASKNPISELLQYWHAWFIDATEALGYLDIPGMNIYDMATDQTGKRNVLFSILCDEDHRANTRSFEFMCQKMSTFNYIDNQYSLLSRALYLREYWAVSLMLKNGLDMDFKDEFGMCGHDYLSHNHNPGRRISSQAGIFNIAEEFLAEWQAIMIAREFETGGNAPTRSTVRL